jgi:hypothetical protein
MKLLKKGLLILLIMLVPAIAFAAPSNDPYKIPDYMSEAPGSNSKPFDLIGFVKTLIN